MTESRYNTAIRSILLDIEGTTTPIEFVYQVLFPFAQAHIKEYLTQCYEYGDVRADIACLRQQHTEDQESGLDPPKLRYNSEESEIESIVAYLHWLMDRDRKSTPLKSLQGRVWEQGYRAGQLRGQLFADVAPAFARWREQDREISIFSSGSILAQKLLFSHTTEGDLTPLVRAYFDTTSGSKQDPESYRRIATALERPPAEIVFVSDVTAELDAARSAGVQTRLAVRPGNHWQPPSAHQEIKTFDELFP